jgi:hypothetical protein
MLLVLSELSCCEALFTFVMKVQYIIQVWCDIEFVFIAAHHDGFFGHTETDI